MRRIMSFASLVRSRLLMPLNSVVAMLVACGGLAFLLAGCEDGGGGGGDDLHTLAAQGVPIVDAAAYGTRNPSPIVLVYQQEPSVNDQYHTAWQDELPDDWIAHSVSDLELVCYFGPQRSVVVGRRTYTETLNGSFMRNITVERRRHQLPATLKEAKTGRTVAQTTLQGGEPRPFNSTEYSYNIYGTSPGPEALQTWLTPYVQK